MLGIASLSNHIKVKMNNGHFVHCIDYTKIPLRNKIDIYKLFSIHHNLPKNCFLAIYNNQINKGLILNLNILQNLKLNYV